MDEKEYQQIIRGPFAEINGNGSWIGPASIKRDAIDPLLMKQFDNMEATIKKLNKMVHQLYFPYRKFEE